MRLFKIAIEVVAILSLLNGPAQALGGAKASGGATLVTKAEGEEKPRPWSLNFGAQLGYESNHALSALKTEGSPVLALEAGGELRLRVSSDLRLVGELSVGSLLIFADASLSGVLVELPILMFYQLSGGWELFVSNHLAVERGRAPPILGALDTLKTAAGTLITLAVYDTLRPAIAYRTSDALLFELGPYFRIKQVTFDQNLEGGDPDYRLMDFGADVLGHYRLNRVFDARLRYDFAFRGFENYKARTPEGLPTDESLQMLRHTVDLQLRAHLELAAGHVIRPVVSAAVRFASSNAGYFDYREYQLHGSLAYVWREKVMVSGRVAFWNRDYTNRTACAASPLGLDVSHPSCSGTEPDVNVIRENVLVLEARAGWSVFDWLTVSFSYEFEDAGASHDVPAQPATPDPIKGNHRLLAGASLSI